MRKLCRAVKELCPFDITSKALFHCDAFKEFYDAGKDDLVLVKNLWSDPAIQKMWSNRKHLKLDVNNIAAFFFNRIDFLPSNDDIRMLPIDDDRITELRRVVENQVRIGILSWLKLF